MKNHAKVNCQSPLKTIRYFKTLWKYETNCGYKNKEYDITIFGYVINKIPLQQGTKAKTEILRLYL